MDTCNCRILQLVTEKAFFYRLRMMEIVWHGRNSNGEHSETLWIMKLPCAIVFSTLKAGMLRLMDEVPSSGSMCIAWKSIERGDEVILPESRWGCNWILHLSSIVLKQRFMLSVCTLRRKQMIGWCTLFKFGKLRNSILECSLIRKIRCSPCIRLLAFFLSLMAIGFLENFPFLPKGSIESLDAGNSWSDTRSGSTLSSSETVLCCVGWVSKLNKNGKTMFLSLWVYKIKMARTYLYACWLCFWIAFSWGAVY